MTEAERRTPTSGFPRGAVMSRPVANIRLHPPDVRVTGRGREMARRAGDFAILSRTARAAGAVSARVRR
jgi:hypothetical protein